MTSRYTRSQVFDMLRDRPAEEVREEIAWDADEEHQQLLAEMASLERMLRSIDKDFPPTPNFELPLDFFTHNEAQTMPEPKQKKKSD